MRASNQWSGIGWIVASHLVARLGDWRRIRNVRQIASFRGLVSWKHSTGDQVQRGSITRTGDLHLLNNVVETAWTRFARTRVGGILPGSINAILDPSLLVWAVPRIAVSRLLRSKNGHMGRKKIRLPRTP